MHLCRHRASRLTRRPRKNKTKPRASLLFSWFSAVSPPHHPFSVLLCASSYFLFSCAFYHPHPTRDRSRFRNTIHSQSMYVAYSPSANFYRVNSKEVVYYKIQNTLILFLYDAIFTITYALKNLRIVWTARTSGYNGTGAITSAPMYQSLG